MSEVSKEETASVATEVSSAIEIDTISEECNLPLTPEQKAMFDRCKTILEAHKRDVPRVAKAIATIESQGYYKFCEGKEYTNVDDYVSEVFGFDRTYIFRMKRYGAWLIKENIPDGQEPSETSVREILQKGFSDEERQAIYRDAQMNHFNRLKDHPEKKSDKDCNDDRDCDSEASGNGESEPQEPSVKTDLSVKFCNIVPEAKDIRKAIMNFREQSGRMYFPLLDNKWYSLDTRFTTILEKDRGKFTSTSVVFSCFRLYKQFKRIKTVDEATTKAIRDCVNRLIDEEKNELENLLNAPTTNTGNK